MKKALLTIASGLLAAVSAGATPTTENSPTNGAVPAGVTKVGGIVADLTGANGTRVVSQLSASSLYVGFANANPLTIGTQTGFSPAVIAALGGGLSEASFRITLFDGDSAPGDFDDGLDNIFFADSVNFGAWSAVSTDNTDSTGATSFGMGTGFGDNILSTGWFSTTNAGLLASLFADLADGLLVYSLDDVDAGDNFYDFTQGVDGGLINVGQGPVVTAPAVPEPATWAMMLIGFGGIGYSMRRRRKVQANLKLA